MKRILVAGTVSLLLCLIVGCATVALVDAAAPLRAWYGWVLAVGIPTLVFTPIVTIQLLRIWDVYFYGGPRPAADQDGRGGARR